MLPCSVIYGTLIDVTCIHWDSQGAGANSSPGACRAYKNDRFRYNLHGATALIMFMAFLIDCLISQFARSVDFYQAESEQVEGGGALASGSSCASKATVRVKKSTDSI